MKQHTHRVICVYIWYIDMYMYLHSNEYRIKLSKWLWISMIVDFKSIYGNGYDVLWAKRFTIFFIIITATPQHTACKSMVNTIVNAILPEPELRWAEHFQQNKIINRFGGEIQFFFSLNFEKIQIKKGIINIKHIIHEITNRDCCTYI